MELSYLDSVIHQITIRLLCISCFLVSFCREKGLSSTLECRMTQTWCSYILLLLFGGQFSLSIAAETLTKGQALSGTQTIVSQEGIFELGFFSKGNNIYLGIWYKEFIEKTIVWVANREAPLSNKSDTPSLRLSEDGNLVLLNEPAEFVWSTNLKLPSQQRNSAEAVLLDNGNFQLRESSNPRSSILWQSFDHPSDTWLPGAKLGFKITAPTPSQRLMEPQRLISWKNSDDPSPGMFSAEVDTDTAGGQLLLKWNKSEVYWSTGIWNGNIFGSVPEMSYIAKFSLVSTQSETYFTYSLFTDIILSRLVMDASGNFKQLTVVRSNKTWTDSFSQPRDPSDVYGFCGEFGVSNATTPSYCTCLQGFAPFSTQNGRMQDGMQGCQRKAPLQCENDTLQKGNKNGFLRISNLRKPTNSIPAQPLQINAAGCESACSKDCSCTAYSFEENSCQVWNGALLDLRENSDATNDRHILYVKLAISELQDASGDKKRFMVIIAVVVSLAGPTLGGLACLGIRRLKLQRGHGNKGHGRDLMSFEFSSSNNVEDNGRIASENDFDLPLFSYASVSAATDNFSVDNKLGEGGFGPVYKGKLLTGQEIAVKRLSRKSGQGLEEFRNEILLIAKLQHTNLVRLLGCCIEKDEKILIYECMPNKSLDFFLFEPNKKQMLDWRTRAGIIAGIAQGLLYLHQYSRLRIIHRDLKASNILLDNEMNPKISDFGMARIFCGNNSEANTNRIVGTYGYMAPEYALGGLSSIKSDVFSFGVLVLEIVSGKKNTGFYYSETPNLLAHAWELWISNRAPELMVPSVLDYPPPTLAAALRRIHIGLLCVQENPNDRPTMSDVVLMLGSELISLPSPKQPAFMANKIAVVKKNSLTLISSNDVAAAAAFSINGLTVSSVQPR